MPPLVYCIKCGTPVGQDEERCPKCSGRVFTNIRPRGRPIDGDTLIGAMKEWEERNDRL
jgi:DNA-directed RNA polymerase subunit RPC12/RpoP